MAGHLGGRLVLEHPAVVQDQDPVGQRDRLDRVVRDDQADPAELREVAAQGVPDMGPGGLVEGGERFVQQQQARTGGQRTGQGDPLGLASGELAGPAVGQVADAEPVQPGLRLAPGLRAGDAVGAEPVRRVGQGAQVREERPVLGDPGDPPAVRGRPVTSLSPRRSAAWARG
ncbi:hypothetical protein GA0115244_104885 [Streptomyces sp. DvalAA-19]|nr:hypothetical protein GA0115244_104885 [Streptomyces sp. DvalAA-19]